MVPKLLDNRFVSPEERSPTNQSPWRFDKLNSVMSLFLILSPLPTSATQSDDNDVGEQRVSSAITFDEVPSSVIRNLNIPSGGADVDISLRDCCIRDDIVEVYVDTCLVAVVSSDDPSAPSGSHGGETHTVSLTEGMHEIEYRNVFSRVGASGWLVSEDLATYTGNRVPCRISSIRVICRPLDSGNDPLMRSSKVGRHCYFLVEDALGKETTYGAYDNKNSGELTAGKNAPSDLHGLAQYPCGETFLESKCFDVTPPSGITLDIVESHLKVAFLLEEGSYDRVTNNSNLWVQRRLNELGIGIDLPSDAITSSADFDAHIPTVIQRLEDCGVEIPSICRRFPTWCASTQ